MQLVLQFTFNVYYEIFLLFLLGRTLFGIYPHNKNKYFNHVAFQLCHLPRKTIYSLPGITATRCKTYSSESFSRFPVPTTDSLPDDIKTTFEEVEEKVDMNIIYTCHFYECNIKIQFLDHMTQRVIWQWVIPYCLCIVSVSGRTYMAMGYPILFMHNVCRWWYIYVVVRKCFHEPIKTKLVIIITGWPSARYMFSFLSDIHHRNKRPTGVFYFLYLEHLFFNQVFFSRYVHIKLLLWDES